MGIHMKLNFGLRIRPNECDAFSRLRTYKRSIHQAVKQKQINEPEQNENWLDLQINNKNPSMLIQFEPAQNNFIRFHFISVFISGIIIFSCCLFVRNT